MTHDYELTSLPPPDNSFISAAPRYLAAGEPAGQPVASEQSATLALERLTRLIGALDAATAALQAEQPAEAVLELVGNALHTLGIESQISLLDSRLGVSPDAAETSPASSTLRVVSISVAPGILRAIGRVAGGSVVDATVPVDQIDVFADVLYSRKPRYLEDTLPTLRQLAPHVPEQALRHLMRLMHASTAVVAPLLYRGRSLGLMSMWADDLRTTDQSILAAFAHLTGMALGGAQLGAEMERNSRRIAALTAIGRDLTASLPIEAALMRAVEHVARSLETAHASLWLIERQHDAWSAPAVQAAPAGTLPLRSGTYGPRGAESPLHLRLAASYGLSAAHRDAACQSSANDAEGEPLLAPALRAIHSATPHAYPDLQQTSPDQLHPSAQRLLLAEGYHALLVVPLLTSDGQAVGALAVYGREAGTFSRDAGPYLEVIGRQIVAAVDHARTFHEVQSGWALLEAVFDADPGALAVVEGPDDTLRMANERLRALSAHPEREPVGLSIHQLFPADRMSLVDGLRSTLAAVRHARRPVMLRGVQLHVAAGAGARTVTLHVAPIHLRGSPGGRRAAAEWLPQPEQQAAVDDALLVIFWDTTAHVRAEDRLAAQVRRAETLARVALALGHERELPALLDHIAHAARELTNADTAGFLLRAAPDEPFQVAATAGVEPGTLHTLHRAFVSDLSILRPLLSHGEPLLITDAPAAVAGAETRLLTRAGVRALAATPLTASGGWIVGALLVGHHVPGAFAAEHAELLDVLAAQAITAVERRRALEQARRHADDLEATFASIAEGVAIYDERGQLRRMNAAGERITTRRAVSGEDNAARQDRFGLRHVDGTLLSPDELPSARAVHGETFYDAEYLVDGEHGSNTVIGTSGAPLRDATGQVRGGVVVFRNVTQVRLLERRTHEALDALLGMAATLVAPTDLNAPTIGGSGSTLAEGGAPPTPEHDGLHATLRQFCQLAIGVLGCDRVGISLVDPGTQHMVPVAIAGLEPAEDAIWLREQQAQLHQEHGRPLGAPLPPEISSKLSTGEALLLDMTQEPYAHLPNPYGARTVVLVPMQVEDQLVGLLALDHRTQDPHPLSHRYSSEEIALAQGVARLAALAVERQRLERVAAEVEALRAANALKEEFLSIASHELKTPLTVLQARTQATQRRLIRMGHTDAAAQFATVQSSLDRILSLVQELLDASRIQAGQLDLSFAPYDLGHLMRAAVNEEQEASGRVITMAGENAPGLWVVADAEHLTQVLTNLIDNAVKYSRPEQPISVRIWRQPSQSPPRAPVVTAGDHDARGPAGDEVIVTVTDAGVGIPPDEVEHVFKRFYRARTSSSRNYGGLGLGLHIAATIVERHGGRIWAESAGPGQGATFGVALPARDRPESIAREGGAAPPPPPTA